MHLPLARERTPMSHVRHILMFSILLAAPASAHNLDSLLSRMTLDEKLGQLNLLPLGEASSFDPNADETTARAAGQDAAAFRINSTSAPMVDIASDTSWGRTA